MERAGKIDVRGLPAGTGAGGSLVAAAIVAFVSVTAFVAFEDLPFGDGADGNGTIGVGGTGPTAVSGDIGSAGGAGAGAITIGPRRDAAAGGGSDAPGARRARNGSPGATGRPGGPGAPPDEAAPPTGTQSAGQPAEARTVVGGTVSGLEATIDATTGVDLDADAPTRPATGVLDQAVHGLTGQSIGGQVHDLTGSTSTP